MTPERIKEIRTTLGLTQDDFATVLGITRSTVVRYEVGTAKPAGEAEKKLAQLDAALVDPKQKSLIQDMLVNAGGAAAVAGALAVGSALFPLAAIVGGSIGLGAILTGSAGKTLFNALKKLNEGENNE